VAQDPTRAAPLTLTAVGVGAAYAPPRTAQSCYLVRGGGRKVVLDLGAGTLNALQELVDPADLDAVVITHLHPDHCVDLFSLRVYMLFGPGAGRRLRLLAPPGTRELLAGFAGEAGWDDAFAFETLAPPGGDRDLGGGLHLRYAEVPHLKPTFAVRIDLGSSSLCYGADCAPNDVLPELARGCDVLVCECTFGLGPAVDGVPHLTARDVAAIAARAGAGRVLVTHVYPEHDIVAVVEEVNRGFDGPVAAARAGEELVA
jgi:ribonuclease BN (tRNA processing enzyme)